MTRLNLVLLVAVMTSALYVVRTQYESRRLFVEIDKANAEARRLVLENERLQVERRAQATAARVEKIAREQLAMRSATPAITQYVTYKAAGSAAAPASVSTTTAAQGTAPGASAAAAQATKGARP